MIADRTTASDALMQALERIENATDVVIIWRKRDENGVIDVDWSCNNIPMLRAVGMLEVAKHEMFDGILHAEDYEDEED